MRRILEVGPLHRYGGNPGHLADTWSRGLVAGVVVVMRPALLRAARHPGTPGRSAFGTGSRLLALAEQARSELAGIMRQLELQYPDSNSGQTTAVVPLSENLFQDVQLLRDGSALVVKVQERPAISSFSIEGNEKIGGDELKKSLKDLGLADGELFKRDQLRRPGASHAVEVQRGRQSARPHPGAVRVLRDAPRDRQLGIRRRRIWVRVTEQGDGTRLVEVAGLARTEGATPTTEVTEAAEALAEQLTVVSVEPEAAAEPAASEQTEVPKQQRKPTPRTGASA